MPKTLTVNVNVRWTQTVSTGQHLSVRCWCGQECSGDRRLVREAHRQHVRNAPDHDGSGAIL